MQKKKNGQDRKQHSLVNKDPEAKQTHRGFHQLHFFFFTILVVWKSRYLYSHTHTHKRVLIRGHINRLTALIIVFFLLLLLLFVAVMENDKTSRHTILCVL